MTQSEVSSLNYQRPLGRAIAHGLRSKCPSCGQGALYQGFVDVNGACKECGEELHHHRADDLPPYLNIFIVGHIIVGLAMISMKYELFGMWTTTIGAALAAIVISIALMRPIKGAVIGLQWAMRMHGFNAIETGKQ